MLLNFRLPAADKQAYYFYSVSILFLPLLLLITRAGIGFFEIVFGLGIVYFSAQLWRQRSTLFAASGWILSAFVLNLIFIIFSLLFSEFKLSALENPLKQCLIILVIGLVVLIKPKIVWFWYGLFLGTAGALSLAIYQYFGLNISRATGFQHPIIFGDLAMLMGLMSLAGIPYFRKKPWSALPYISFVAGLLTSVLSAARGGWFALPLIVLPLFFYRKKISKGEYIALFSFILLLLLIFFSTDIDWVGVQQRLNDIKYDIQQYQTGNAATSIGVRFELWKAALKIFSEHPFFGAGPDLKPLLQQLSSRGELEGAATYYSHVHNEILNVLAIRGVVGLLGLLLLYIAPLMFFLKIFFQGKEINQSYALAGLILVISFISFGFTQVLFTHHLSAGFYSLGIALLAGFCILQEQA